MSRKVKVYVDQNVISGFYGRPLDFDVPENCQVVCSPALFDDFRVSEEPQLHLQTLESLNCCLVCFEVYTGKAKFDYTNSMRQLFDKNEEKRKKQQIDELPTNKVRAMASSGRGVKAAKDEWERYAEAQIKRARASGNPNDELCVLALKILNIGMGDVFKKLDGRQEVEPGESLLGVVNSDDYSPPEALRKLWEDTADKSIDPTPEIYFGFSSHAGLTEPLLKAFDQCCGIFDRYQFLAESKRKNPSKQNNIQNDAAHLAYATTCDVLVSSDKKLIKRAEVIYSHFGYSCKPVWVSPKDPINTNTFEKIIRIDNGSHGG